MRGKPLAENLSLAEDFARVLADRLASAQRTKPYTVEMAIANTYWQVDDVPAVLDKIQRIVRLVAAAVAAGARLERRRGDRQ